jgi:hypothetical protein
MRKLKELSACIALFQAVHARNEVGPEQKKHLEYAINELRELRRRPHAKHYQVHGRVRKVVEALAKAFLDR